MTAERPNEAAASNSFEFDALREAVRYRTALVKEFTPFLNGRVIEKHHGGRGDCDQHADQNLALVLKHREQDDQHPEIKLRAHLQGRLLVSIYLLPRCPLLKLPKSPYLLLIVRHGLQKQFYHPSVQEDTAGMYSPMNCL